MTGRNTTSWVVAGGVEVGGLVLLAEDVVATVVNVAGGDGVGWAAAEGTDVESVV